MRLLELAAWVFTETPTTGCNAMLACLAFLTLTAAAQHAEEDKARAPQLAQKRQLMTSAARLKVDLQLFAFFHFVVLLYDDKRVATLPCTHHKRHFRS